MAAAAVAKRLMATLKAIGRGPSMEPNKKEMKKKKYIQPLPADTSIHLKKWTIYNRRFINKE